MSYYKVDEVLNSSLNLYQKNFVPIALASLVLGLPAIFVQATVDLQKINSLTGTDATSIVTILAMSIISQTVLAGVIVKQTMENGMSSYTEPLKISDTGWTWIIPAILAVIVESFLIMCGMVLFIIPGFILFMAFAYTFPIIVLEKEYRPVDVIRRSWTLTSGDRFYIFANLAIFWIASFVLSLLSSAVFSLIGFKGTFLLFSEFVVSSLVAPLAGYICLVMYLGKRMHLLKTEEEPKEEWSLPNNKF